jgi:hypothetical protein
MVECAMEYIMWCLNAVGSLVQFRRGGVYGLKTSDLKHKLGA